MNTELCSTEFIHKHITKLNPGEILVHNCVCWIIVRIEKCKNYIYDFRIELKRVYDNDGFYANVDMWATYDTHIMVFKNPPTRDHKDCLFALETIID